MTHAGYRQLASQQELPANVRRSALDRFIEEHEGAMAALRSSAFTPDEARAIAKVKA